MFFIDKKAKNNSGIADLFSARFSEVFAAPAHISNLVFNSIIAHDSFCDFQFTRVEVFKHIMSLYNSFSSGSDAIPVLLL